jgi:hypothetical protein
MGACCAGGQVAALSEWRPAWVGWTAAWGSSRLLLLLAVVAAPKVVIKAYPLLGF